MKKILKKIKAIITALGIAITSFFSKVMAQLKPDYCQDCGMVALYGVPSSYYISAYVKTAQKLLIGVIFVIGIINFIKIKRTKDKAQKGKKIRKTIITISIIIVIILLMALAVWLLNRYNNA